MPVKIAICDDAAEDAKLLENALYAYDHTFEIITYTSGQTLIDEFLDSKQSADILFLDVYMPGIDGIETAQKIRAAERDIKIIFVSSSREHYPQAYEVFAFNYIVKPFEKGRLYEVINRAINEIGKTRRKKISIKYKSSAYTIECRDIAYIESQDRLLLFHMADGKTLQCYGRLDEIAKELPERAFIRCHQSFIVNAFHITEMKEHYFRLGQISIGISKKNLKAAKEQYYNCLFSRMDGGRMR